MTIQIAPRISQKAKEQLDQLAEIFESQRVALEIIINDAYQKYSDSHNLWLSARQRVIHTPELSQYKDIILYDWPNQIEHLAWVLTAPVEEILDWAESVDQSSLN